MRNTESLNSGVGCRDLACQHIGHPKVLLSQLDFEVACSDLFAPRGRARASIDWSGN